MSEVGINISCWNFFRPFSRKHKNIQPQRKDELEVTQLGLRDRISDLPDEILCYILSFLTLRESVRTRLLSARWRYLCDCRSVLQFDALNVFGRKTVSTAFQQSKFVRAVDQFIQLWKSRNNVHGIKINFPLGVEHTSNIDRWVRSFIRMGIRDLSLVVENENEKTYLLSGNLLHSEEAFFLESLSLGDCELTLSSDGSSWISHLTTLDLFQVILKAEDMEFILSNGLNLSSLSLVACLWSSPSPLKVELPRLKKLVVHESVDEIVLNCTNLEILYCKGHIKCFKLSHLPLLSEVKLGLFFPPNGCSSIFCALTRHAPQLQALSLLVMTAVHPLPASNIISRLKRLDLQVYFPYDFDLFTITHFLNACPFLEVLHIELCTRYDTNLGAKRKYPDRSHFHLKEVKLDRFRETGDEMELARYFHKNAVALQRMVINEICVSLRDEKLQLQDVETTPQLVNEKV